MLSKGFATCFDEDAFEPKEKYINLFEISTYNIYIIGIRWQYKCAEL